MRRPVGQNATPPMRGAVRDAAGRAEAGRGGEPTPGRGSGIGRLAILVVAALLALGTIPALAAG